MSVSMAHLYVLDFLPYAYSRCLVKDVLRFSCIKVHVFPLTKTELEFSGLLCAVSEAIS
jgi:hypothetical protein